MKNNRYDRFFRRKWYLSPIGTPCHFAYAADAPLLSLSRHFPRFSGRIYPEGGSKICHCEPQARQSPGRVNFRMLLSPIVGVADTSPEGGSKKYVILSISEISHRKSKQNIFRRPTPSREFASLRSQRQSNFLCHCEAQSAAAIPWSKARSIYRVLFQGERHANCDSALNADALKLSFFAFLTKMQV